MTVRQISTTFLLVSVNKMKNSPVRLTGLFLFLLSSFGCGKSHDLVGTWNPDNMPKGIVFNLVFKPDNTWSQSLADSSQSISASGTYRLDNDSLTMTQLNGSLKKGSQSPPITEHVKWITDDKIELTIFKQKLTYTRKK
jgi:hypothetical protein